MKKWSVVVGVCFVLVLVLTSTIQAQVVRRPSRRAPACPSPTPTVPTAVQFFGFNAEYKNGLGLMLQVQTVMEINIMAVQFAYKDGTTYGRLIGSPIPAQYPGIPVSGTYMEILTGPLPGSSPCFVVNYWENSGYHGVFDPWPYDCAHPQD